MDNGSGLLHASQVRKTKEQVLSTASQVRKKTKGPGVGLDLLWGKVDKGSGLLHRLPGEKDKGTRCLGLGLLWVKEDKGSGLLHRLPGKE